MTQTCVASRVWSSSSKIFAYILLLNDYFTHITGDNLGRCHKKRKGMRNDRDGSCRCSSKLLATSPPPTSTECTFPQFNICTQSAFRAQEDALLQAVLAQSLLQQQSYYFSCKNYAVANNTPQTADKVHLQQLESSLKNCQILSLQRYVTLCGSKYQVLSGIYSGTWRNRAIAAFAEKISNSLMTPKRCHVLIFSTMVYRRLKNSKVTLV